MILKSAQNVRPLLFQKQRIKLNVTNVNGQKVASLMNKSLSAGNYSVLWDGKNYAGETVSRGVYFLNLQVGRECYNKRIVFRK